MRRWAFLLIMLLPAFAHAGPSSCDFLAKQIATTGSGPVFVASYPTATIDQLRGVAFFYDNAVAALALIGCGDEKSAARIGDAMLFALAHDRYWHDGRLRNAYLAGSQTNKPVKLPGWWDKKQNMWVEDDYQVGSDTGNMAWGILALIALHRSSGDPRYLDGAKRIAKFLDKSFDARAPLGYTGGTLGDEPSPQVNLWKSTEHNTDIAAAFRELADDTGDAHWRARAATAQNFAAAMWDAQCECFAAGTLPDGHTPNAILALDAEIWPLLALPEFAERFQPSIATAEQHMGAGDGFSYSEAKEGVWTEGTAQAALLMELLGQPRKAALLMTAAERNRIADGSYYASSAAQQDTGFRLDTDPTKPRLYFHLLHLAAVSWVAMEQRRFNPFTATTLLPEP